MNTIGDRIRAERALRTELKRMRTRLDLVFAADTSSVVPPPDSAPSFGHCAVVAMLVRERVNGEYISTKHHGVSHWFNRVMHGSCWFDVDLTADQFGHDPVLVSDPNALWPGTLSRSAVDLNEETRARFDVLRKRFLAVVR